MILRKPYAFFIKHFRLIHIILAILTCYLIFRTKLILDFFNDYAANIMNVVGQDLTGTLMYGLIYVIPFLIIIVTITVMVVMVVKKKPYFIYMVNIVGYIYAIVMLQVARSTLLTMELSLIDVRTVRLVRDLISVSFIIQIIVAMIMIVRATGFDIKKFGFKQDLQELEIDEEDREEFEVQINIDGNKARRKINYIIRRAKYVYLENKLVCHLIALGIIVTIAYGTVNGIINKQVILEQNKLFHGNNFTISLLESYVTNTDYAGKELDEDFTYLILKIKAKNNTTKQAGIDIATTKVVIGNFVYTPTTRYKDSFIEFGNVYQGENIGSEYEYKTLVYQIPKQIISRKMIFSFVDKTNIDKDGFFVTSIVNIKYNDLTKNNKKSDYKLGDTISFDKSIINGYQLKISAFDVQKSYKLSYNFCPKTCLPSYEYLYPSITSNHNKVLLKITGELTKGETNNLVKDVYDPYDFIYYFATLEYKINDEIKKQNIQFKEVIPRVAKSKTDYYIEVVDEVMNASQLTLYFQIRNETYTYILK